MARSFPGSNASYLNLSNPTGPLDISGGPAITIAFWMLPVAMSGTQLLVSKTAAQYNLFINGASLKFECGSQSLTGGSPSTSAWTHVAARKSGSGMAILVGGAVAASNALAGAITDTTADLRVGMDASGGNFPYNGRMAELAIWGAALSDDEIAALAKGVSPFRVHPSGLAGYYPMWGVGAAGEPDVSGGRPDLSEVGTVGVVDHPPVGPPFPGAR